MTSNKIAQPGCTRALFFIENIGFWVGLKRSGEQEAGTQSSHGTWRLIMPIMIFYMNVFVWRMTLFVTVLECFNIFLVHTVSLPLVTFFNHLEPLIKENIWHYKYFDKVCLEATAARPKLCSKHLSSISDLVVIRFKVNINIKNII